MAQNDEVLVDVNEEAVVAQSFMEKNQNMVLGIVGALVIGVSGFFGHKYLVQEPNNVAASEQIFKAEEAFARDSFKTALLAAGSYPGFEEIASEFGSTPSGNIANYYAGVSNLKLKNYDAAIEKLEAFSAPEELSSAVKNGLLGDAYSEKKELDKAFGFYQSAASASTNEVFAPYYLYKAGLLATKLGKKETALSLLESIKKDYPFSHQAANIDAYIAQAK